MLLEWKDGVEKGPSGNAREIPQRYVWSSSIWMTKDGACYRKFYNAVTEEWAWESDMVDFVEDENGRMGLHLPYFIPIETLICMAWRSRVPYSPTKVYVREDRDAVANHLRWEEEEEVIEEQEKEPEDTYRDEEWRPLRHKCGMVKCDNRYELSNYGRLKNRHGEVTCGFWCYGSMWAAVKHCGLLNLTEACSRSKDLPFHVLDARNMMMRGYTPEDHSFAKGVKESTSWAHFNKASQFIKGHELRKVAEALVDPHLWKALERLKRRENPVLGGPLKVLMDTILEKLPEFEEEEYAYDQLRLARTSLVV